jgi:diguanylate cyclase (GGDEF)-like protein/PAS domain S-box-containing protein
VLLWLHVPGLAIFALAVGETIGHAVFEAGIVLGIAAVASSRHLSRAWATVTTAVGLLTASAVLVHLSGGLIEMHFHYFVMVGVVTLYQQWGPFLAAIGYVVVQHGVGGAVSPMDVFNHQAAIDHPWRWAAIHGVFILGMSGAGIISWRLNESLLVAATDREQRLAEAQQVARLGSWEWDLATGEITWSDEMYRLGDTEAGSFRPTPARALARIDAADRAAVEAAMAATASEGRSGALDFRLTLPEGGTRWVHGRWTVNAWRDGQPSKIAGTTQDITERLAVEAERERTQKELEATLSLLTATLESTADGILVVDPEGNISSFNTQFAEMWRLPLELLESRNDNAALSFVLQQVADPEGFVAKVRELYAQPNAESHDSIEFRDGRVFERYSKPQFVGGAVVGRVWSFRDVTERRRLEEELAHQAFHDSLTNLANQALFRDRVEHALARAARAPAPVAVLFIDLDHFKTVNDSLGHTIGDELLTAVADRIRTSVRTSDTAARLGGDEFAVLVEDSDAADVVEIADRILDTVQRPVTAGGREVVVTASVGIAFSQPGGSVDQLLRNADLAMYTAKAHGRNRHDTYESGMHAAAVEKLELAGDLRRALERGEIVVHYQPIVALPTEQILGVEALVRWEHPTRGLLAPAAFIPLAEETGLIQPLGRLVLRETCAQLRRWTRDGVALTASVNVSARQLADDSFVADVAAALRDHDVPPTSLVLELTESALMEDTDRAVAVLHGLKGLGVRLAVDDFGTGYSSLSYLHRFPIDILKIDRSFVADISSDSVERSLAQAIVSLAASLELVAIAEGVETEAQSVLLGELGCAQAQGFHFSRPVPAEDIEDLLQLRLASLTA